MNVFVLSPGRTATTTLSEALNLIEGYTSTHESRVNRLGSDRVDYPSNHIECDNRLVWFLPRLTKKYGREGVLVVVHRDKHKIAQSYNKRWRQILIMKSYSQGILMRKLSENNFDVCMDYVENIYETLEYYFDSWMKVIHIDLNEPEVGIGELLFFLEKTSFSSDVNDYIRRKQSNLNRSDIVERWEAFKFNLKCLFSDLR